MPCNGISVMSYERRERNEAAREIINLLETYPMQAVSGFTRTQCGKGWKVDLADNGIIKLAIIVPTPQGDMPINISIEDGGIVTCVTQSGTFEGGKFVLEKLIAQALMLKGVDLSSLKFETHNHKPNKNAPRLHYGRTHVH
jgi:hypothetical protein